MEVHVKDARDFPSNENTQGTIIGEISRPLDKSFGPGTLQALAHQRQKVLLKHDPFPVVSALAGEIVGCRSKNEELCVAEILGFVSWYDSNAVIVDGDAEPETFPGSRSVRIAIGDSEI